MLSENDIKEELSYAYVHAVASYAGFSCEPIRKDRDSVDANVRAKGWLDESSKFASPALDLQLKATCEPTVVNGRIVFDLKMKNYDELRQRTQTPRLLVVLALPDARQEWLRFEPEQLIARRCCYWHSLIDEPDVENQSTRRIKIDQRQVFSPQALRRLLVKASRFEDIPNGVFL